MHIFSYSLLRYVLISEAGITLTNDGLLYNLWHKPSLKKHPYIHFNISHCSTAIAVAISFRAPIGIDIEAIREYSPYSLNRCFSKEEKDYIKNSINPNKEFFRLWTLKESYVKAIGIGMSYPMKKVNFNNKNHLIVSNKVKCRFLLIEDNSNYVTSCCYGVGKARNNGEFHRIYQCKKNIFHG
ncbi:MAG: 4'-phosphopantetheinyl transferase family protein [Clostridiaceae bacterium]